MDNFSLDLHLDEDARFALTDEEMAERLKKFKLLEDETLKFRKAEKKVLNEIKRLQIRNFCECSFEKFFKKTIKRY